MRGDEDAQHIRAAGGIQTHGSENSDHHANDQSQHECQFVLRISQTRQL